MPRKRTNKQQSTETQQSQKPAQDNPPGFTLRYTLRGHTNAILRIAWSPDGRVLASGSVDNTIRL